MTVSSPHGREPEVHQPALEDEPGSNEPCGANGSGGDPAARRAAKRLWLNEYSTLRQKVADSERLATVPSDMSGALEKERSTLSAGLARDSKRLQTQCAGAKRLVAAARSKAESCRPDSNSIADLAQVLERAEAEIAGLKGDCREEYNALMDQETILLRDLEIFSERLVSAAWETDTKPCYGEQQDAPKQAKAPKSANRPHLGEREQGTLLPDVVAFENYREEFGDTGNWHPEEHKEFLRILKACKLDYGEAVMACCDRILVGFEREDIVAHARWHQVYVDLEIRKRLAIAEWRERKAEEREQAKSVAAVEVFTAQQAQEAKKEAEERRLEHRTRQKKAIEEWRANKRREEEEAAQKEGERRREELRARERERAAQMEKKAALAEFRLRRVAEQERAHLEQERGVHSAAAQSAQSQEQRDRVRERERKLQEQREKRLRAKREEKEAAEARQRLLRERLAPKVERDVGRLLSGTSSTAHRQRAVEEQRTAGARSVKPGFIRDVPKLGVPTYLRRG